jgi:hypothetical protein
MEEVDEQLNATAKHLLQQAVPDTHAAHINNFSTAKEVWDYLTTLFVGNKSIRSSKFDELKSEERYFIMRDNETPDEMYQRILALATTLTGFGCKDNGDDCQTYVHYNGEMYPSGPRSSGQDRTLDV